MKGRKRYRFRVVEWDEFVVIFFDKFFPLELRETNVPECINLNLGNMSVKE